MLPAEVVKTISMYGEMHRMVPSLALMAGFRTAEIAVTHHPRLHGRSKYGWKRFLRSFLDMWTVSFSRTTANGRCIYWEAHLW